jgi:hypothetical protein
MLIWGGTGGAETLTGRPQGPFFDSNIFASLINLLGIPVFVWYLTTSMDKTRPWQRVAGLSFIALIAFVFLLTASRGATLSLFLVTVIMLWGLRGQSHLGRKLILILVVVGCSNSVASQCQNSVPGQLDLSNRLTSAAQQGEPTRIMLFRTSVSMIGANPFIGYGPGSFALLYPKFRDIHEISTAGGWVHNDYLQIWLEAGLPMLLLVAGLFVWTFRRLAIVARGNHGENIINLGWLGGIGAVLMHANVNFLLYFPLITLVLGLYLAAIDSSDGASTDIQTVAPERPVRWAALWYAVILGWFCVGTLAVQVFLGQAKSIQTALLEYGIAYPRYSIAYWLSVVAPFHPAPQHVMGLELSGTPFSDTPLVISEALMRMEWARRLAPCYMPYYNDALSIITANPIDENSRQYGMNLVEQALNCNPRHGLIYYHAGLLTTSRRESIAWWLTGLRSVYKFSDMLFLVVAIQSEIIPEHQKKLRQMTQRIKEEVIYMENNPATGVNQRFWDDIQLTLNALSPAAYRQLLKLNFHSL